MTGASAGVQWAVASRPLAGDVLSGDLAVVISRDSGVLAGVIDGAGHGPEAAAAAECAQAVLEGAAGQPLAAVFEACHEALRRTRGAAMSLAWLDLRSSTVEWSGVGNVEAVLAHADGRREALLLRGGVVGYQMNRPRISSAPLERGDLLVFATDGLRADFTALVAADRDPRWLADEILARHGKTTDDALVLAVRRS